MPNPAESQYSAVVPDGAKLNLPFLAQGLPMSGLIIAIAINGLTLTARG